MARRRPAALVLGAVLLLAGCAGTPDERACGLLEDVPDRVGQASVGQLNEVAEAARVAESAELRSIGEQLALNLARRRALENLAAGSFIDVIQANVDELRRACSDLEATEDGSE